MIKTKFAQDLTERVSFAENGLLIVDTLDKEIYVDLRYCEVFAVVNKFTRALEFKTDAYNWLSHDMKIRVNSLLVMSLQNDLERTYDELRFLESDFEVDVDDLQEA